ncbi:metal-dependent hydrolase [Sphingobium nicotianae]|uniref:Metal-dependent hydrolase n=1 Tax=Sphingobium nicotianae TaxID=2782607 RepID=A0A9X1D8J3_9SPHN|nr:metal-dependent hydrolase [Sphingobium nicotianae]MBT2185614.1 metal-dependent hydrolase [Sphingobium nicotianae]
MDNFTHSLVGWALGQTGLKCKTRKGLAALVLGANMPDIDVFLGWMPWPPLAMHRGFTHGLIGGAIVMPPLLAGLLWLLDRWQISRGQRFKSGFAMRFRWLLALSWLGALTHPLLDLQTTYAVQLLSPFSTLWFHTETLFIIDAVIWTVLPFAIWLSRRRERAGGAWRRPAIVGLVAICAYVGLNGVISLASRSALLARVPHPPEILFANEEPVLFWRRSLIWRQDGRIGRARYDPLRSLREISGIGPGVPDNMADPLVRRAMTATPEIRSFMRWSVMPMARIVEKKRCSATILFSDARFGEPDRGGLLVRRVWLPLAGPACSPGR